MSDVMQKNIVLFVDDEQQILNSIRRATEDEPFKSIFASSGQEALQYFENQTISVIVTDMRMPGMDGLTLLKLIREKSPKTVRIVLSGYTQLSQVLATVNHGDIFQFIPKPWSMEEELLVTIRQAIEHFNLETERERLQEGLVQKNTAYQNMFRTIEQSLAKERRDLNHLKKVNHWIFSFWKKFSNGIDTNAESKALMGQYVDLIEGFQSSYIDLLPLSLETRTSEELILEIVKATEEKMAIQPSPEMPAKISGYHTLFLLVCNSLCHLLNGDSKKPVLGALSADRKNPDMPVLIFDIEPANALGASEINRLRIACSLLSEIGKAYNMNIRLKQEENQIPAVRIVWAAPNERKG